MGRPKKNATPTPTKKPKAAVPPQRNILDVDIVDNPDGEGKAVRVHHVPAYVHKTPANMLAELAKVRAQINKGTSKGCRPIIMAAEEVDNPYDLRRPCGITQLDVDTGGGLPAGGLVQITGANGVGKTALIWKYFAMHQKLYGEASALLYAPVEFLPDWRHLRERYGLRISLPPGMVERTDMDLRARGLTPLTKAERHELLHGGVGTFDILRSDTTETLLDSVNVAFESNLYGLIAIDSISILQPSTEASLNSLEDEPTQAANARLLTRFCQRYHPLATGVRKDIFTTLVVTAQVRSNRKKSELPTYMSKYLRNETGEGGANAIKHGKLVDITLWPEDKIKDKNNKDIILGKNVKWEIPKGKAGSRDNITGSYTFWYDKSDDVESIIEAGIRYGACLEAGGNLTFINKDTGEPLVTEKGVLAGIAGVNELRELLRESVDTEIIIRREILAAAGISICMYR